MPRKPQKKTAPKPMTIEIHGGGIDISAKFTGYQQLVDHFKRGIEAVLDAQRAATTEPIAAVEAEMHDFDVVLRVIKLADPKVLEAFATMVAAEIDFRRARAATQAAEAAQTGEAAQA